MATDIPFTSETCSVTEAAPTLERKWSLDHLGREITVHDPEWWSQTQAARRQNQQSWKCATASSLAEPSPQSAERIPTRVADPSQRWDADGSGAGVL